MSKTTIPEKLSSVALSVVLGAVACAPIEDRPTVGGASPVDTAPTALFDDTYVTGEDTPPSGEIPLGSPVITGSLQIEQVQEPVGTESAPYVPDSYITYAQGRGLDIPSNVSPEVDAQFREFYNYVFNQQFEITNPDGTVTIGSLLSASNPEINIFIAPDGTPYVEGPALDNDPAFGGGDHYFLIIGEDTDSIVSVRISKQIGKPHINGLGDYTAVSPEGDIYFYNTATNTWDLAPSAPTALPTGTPVPTPTALPTGTPVPTPTALPTGTPVPVPTVAPTAAPTAFRNEGEEFLEIDFGVPGVENPVPAILLQTYEDPEAASRLDPNAVHVVAAEARNGFTAVMVYPAYIKELRIYQVYVPIDGVTYETQFADLIIAYLNNSGVPTEGTVRMFKGFAMGETGDHDPSDLIALLGQPVRTTTVGDFSAASDGASYMLLGEPRGKAASADVLSYFLTGGSHLSPGWTYTIRPYSHP